ncbi:MAG: Ig-like domain-containing protein [Lachnospiraceae bacterium]|nr:Ig-like domain-containing protein [Lachnospiraceae bacterium]
MKKGYFNKLAILLSLCIIMTSFPMSCVGAVEDIQSSEVTTENNKEVVSSLIGMETAVEDDSENIVGSGQFPVSYNNLDLMTPLRTQHTPTCLAFASVAAMETSLVKQGIATKDVDLSEFYLTKAMGYANIRVPVYNKLQDWVGITSEANAPESLYTEDGGKQEDSSFRRPELYHIKNSFNLDINDVDSIKQAIMDYGSVQMDYCYDFQNDGHAMCIIGWDDTVDDENDSYGPGVWICKNSWNMYSKFCYDESKYIGTITVFELESVNEYDHNYGTMTGLTSSGKHDYSFEINQNSEGKKEEVKSLGLATSTKGEYSFKIYNSEKEGILSEQSFTVEHPGYYTIPLNTSVVEAQGKIVHVEVTGPAKPYKMHILTKDTVQNTVNTISLNSDNIVIQSGDTGASMGATLNYGDGNDTIRYESMDTSVVTVNSEGLLTPAAGGDTYVKAYTDTDTVWCKVRVYRKISEASGIAADGMYPGNGNKLTPVPTLSMNGTVLVSNTDYLLSGYRDNENIGTGYVTVTGKGFYTGTKDIPFSISQANIEDAIRQDSKMTMTYNPEGEYNPEGLLLYNGRTINLMDYTITSEANTIGARTFTIKGKNNFYGTKQITINILRKKSDTYLRVYFASTDKNKALWRNESAREAQYTGNPVEPDVEVEGTFNGKTIKFAAKDYTVTYYNNVLDSYYDYDKKVFSMYNPIRTAGLTVSLNGDCCYEGESVPYDEHGYTTNFEIKGYIPPYEGPEYLNMENATVEDTFTFPSSFLKKEFHPIVKDENGKVLTEGEEYTVYAPRSYFIEPEQIEIGLFGVEEKGYQNRKIITYTVTKRPITDITVGEVAEQQYTGKEIKPIPVMSCEGVKFDNIQINVDQYLDVSYQNNISVGTATITITGKENGPFDGSITKTFVIKGNSGTDPTPPDENSSESLTLVQKEKYQIETTVGATYTTSNKKVASVSKKGLVTAVKGGTADITINTSTKTKIIHVTVDVPKISAKSYEVTSGNQITLTLNDTTLTPEWKSLKPTIATVSNGVVTGISKGSTKIYATVHGKNYISTIKVVTPVISKSSIYLKVTKGITLKLKNTKQSVIWKSSKDTIATVSPKGKVIGTGLGTVTVTAYAGGDQYICEVEVIPNEKPKLVASTIYLTKGVSGQLSMRNSYMQPVWTVPDTNYASITENGKITTYAKGKVKATGILYGKKYAATIIVEEPVLSSTELTLISPLTNKQKSKAATIKVKNTKQKFTYESADPSIATVTVKGKITPISVGTTIVTATTADGVLHECLVTIE